MSIMKLKSLLDRFRNNHPKVIMFFRAVSGKIGKDTVLELKVTSPDGQSLVTNMRVTEEDMELFREIGELMANQNGQQ